MTGGLRTRLAAVAAALPATTTQAVRTVSTDRWCDDIWCTVTEAWERVGGRWRLATGPDDRPAVFRSTIGPNGFGKQREGDGRTPSGYYGIPVTISTGEKAPGEMPWRRRLPTSTVSPAPGENYNTWLEVPGITTGDRPAMRIGFLVDFNNPRLTPGQGPAPVPYGGSGIFFHTSRPGAEWAHTEGCVQLGDPAEMTWVVRWLDPAADPKVVLDR
jgi:L,D-peptidoglycan transpeptidase YkuD (ErfK/YbiS/YcfS/YnhG family)